MTKIAVIKTGGKQYKVKEDESLKIEKINNEVGDKVDFETLLVATEDGKTFELGTPSLEKKVKAQVIEHGQGKKIMVVKYKNKTRYLRTKGHRQPFTKIKVEKIS